MFSDLIFLPFFVWLLPLDNFLTRHSYSCSFSDSHFAESMVPSSKFPYSYWQLSRSHPDDKELTTETLLLLLQLCHFHPPLIYSKVLSMQFQCHLILNFGHHHAIFFTNYRDPCHFRLCFTWSIGQLHVRQRMLMKFLITRDVITGCSWLAG